MAFGISDTDEDGIIFPMPTATVMKLPSTFPTLMRTVTSANSSYIKYSDRFVADDDSFVIEAEFNAKKSPHPSFLHS